MFCFVIIVLSLLYKLDLGSLFFFDCFERVVKNNCVMLLLKGFVGYCLYYRFLYFLCVDFLLGVFSRMVYFIMSLNFDI